MTGRERYDAFLRAEAERLLSAQSVDPRGDAEQRAGRAVSGHSRDLDRTNTFNPTIVACRGGPVNVRPWHFAGASAVYLRFLI